MVVAALLVLFLSMVSNNRFLFFLGALLVTAEFGIYTYRWIHDNKGIKWSWGDMRITGLIYCCIITGLVLLFMLIGAFLLLRAANATGIFTILMRSSIILGILLSITLDVLPLLTKEWSAESWSDTIDRYQFPCDGFIAYIPMAFIVLLGAKWMDLRLDEAAAVKAAKTPAQPEAAPDQPVAPVPVYTAPAETPDEAPVAAPVETPAEASVEAPAEVSAEASAETTAEAPAEVPAEEPEEPLPFAKYDDPAEATEEAATKAADAAAEAADALNVTEEEVNAFLNGTVNDVTDATAETASTAVGAVTETTEAAAETAAESLTNVEEKLF